MMRVAWLAGAMVMVTALCAMSGCEEEEKSTSAAPSATTARAALSAPPPKPVASAEPPAKPRDDCPEGSSGLGTFAKPCEGKGDARLVEVTWTGKKGDAGPHFRCVNKSKLDILFGKVAVYFYDKAGKQLDPKGGDKRPMQICSGNIFDGPLKAGEKAVISFSCVSNADVPDGTTQMEAEMEQVGFSDAAGKKSEYYWRNKDLVPDQRPMEKGKKKKK